MTYRWVEHTAELGLEIEADTVAKIFDEASAAFGELVADGGDGRPQTHAITLTGETHADLLVAWLEELVFLADTVRFVPAGAEVTVGPPELDGTVTGRRGAPRPLVKAVTYHQLAFERDGDVWRARVVLDV